MHEKKGYKFFCFSNIFPYGDFQTGSEKNLLISSPDLEVLKSIESACHRRIESDQPIIIDNLRFKISGISKPFRIDLMHDQVNIITATPIVVRIPKAKFEDYGIELKINYNYLFWREDIPVDAFVNQLYENIAKKVKGFLRIQEKNLYTAHDLDEGYFLPMILSYKFIKSVSKPIVVKQAKQMIIGSLWNFSFFAENAAQKAALEIAIDSGLGERNSLGFGFVNLIRNQ
ncbi:MAG: CRISPR-associated endoribonuclease Cas6 [Nitrososphaerota archaeon]|nr:CRISPR-associated endoribonuclease Cas6 [Nitrososphaerota archaeon]